MKMILYRSLATVAVAVFLGACGGGGGGSPAAIPGPAIPTATISGVKLTGQSATIAWSSTNASSCSASDAWTGTKAIGGSETVALATGSVKYSITCTGPGGSTQLQQVVLTGDPLPVPVVTLSSTPAGITLGQVINLAWTSTNSTACTASESWSGSYGASGQTSITPTMVGQYSYALTCTGPGGSAAKTVVVAVNAVSTPAPTVAVALASPKTPVGGTNTLTWSSTNATSCAITDSLNVPGLITSGTRVLAPTVGGQYKYTVTCTGAGGTFANSIVMISPITVQRTSYLNFKNNGQGQAILPQYTHAMAYGDFFQDGSISLMTSPVVANVNNPSDATKTGKIHFYKKIGGNWTDRTTEILSDDRGCVWPRKAVSADFNGDGKPDIFLACHGFDASPFDGEKQVLFLSQTDGSYKRTVLDIFCYCHGASAADLKNNGFADVVITDTGTNFKQPMYLRNNHDGTFTPSATELSPTLAKFSFPGQTVAYPRGIYSLEFVDANGDGNPDLYVAGNDIDWQGNTEFQSLAAITPKIFFNNNNTFTGNPISIPINTTQFTSLDILIEGDILWTLKSDYKNPQFLIQQFDLKKMVEGTPKYVPYNGIFWIIRDFVKGIVTAG